MVISVSQNLVVMFVESRLLTIRSSSWRWNRWKGALLAFGCNINDPMTWSSDAFQSIYGDRFADENL